MVSQEKLWKTGKSFMFQYPKQHFFSVFWIRDITFSFCTGTHKWRSQLWCGLIVFRIHRYRKNCRCNCLIYVGILIYVCAHMCVYICMCVPMTVCVNVCVCVCACTHNSWITFLFLVLIVTFVHHPTLKYLAAISFSVCLVNLRLQDVCLCPS